MKFNIRGENVEVTEAIRNHVTSKISKIERYFDKELRETAYVKLWVNKTSQKVEVTIPMKKLTLRAEVKHEDLYAAIDLVVDKLERQIRKHKTRVNRKFREIGHTTDFIVDVPATHHEEQEDDLHIVRTKSISLLPMDVEEAILQMNMLGHDFFLFINGDTGRTCAVYRRNEDSYGLLETEE